MRRGNVTVRDAGSRRTLDKELPCGSEAGKKKIQHKVFVSKVYVVSFIFPLKLPSSGRFHFGTSCDVTNAEHHTAKELARRGRAVLSASSY